MTAVSTVRQDEDLRAAKQFLTNISNRRAERYYYPDGSAKYSVIQIDSIQVMDVLERLVTRVETLEENQVIKLKPKVEVTKRRLSFLPSRKWWVKRKVTSNGVAINYIPWWGRPIEGVANLFR